MSDCGEGVAKATPNFRVIVGGRADKEEREQKAARTYAKFDVGMTARELSANILRIIRGEGEPHKLLLQINEVIDSAAHFQAVHGYSPDNSIADALRLWSEDEELWDGERLGKYTREEVERLLADGEHGRMLSEHTIQRGVLQAIASAMIDERLQKLVGKREFYKGLRAWVENREERLHKRREAAAQHSC